MLITEIKFLEKLTPAMKQYVSLKGVHKDSLLFFRMGDFYELFFDDAILASKELNITLTKRGKVEEEEIPMCGIPHHSIDNYLPKLIRNGFSVAICEQTDTPENMKSKGLSGPIRREVVRIITPGTLLEDHLLESKNFNFLGSLFVEKFNFSFSWSDISTGVFKTNDFVSSSLSEMKYKLENILSKLNLSELLIPDDLPTDLLPLNLHKIIKKIEGTSFDYEQNSQEVKKYFEKSGYEYKDSFTRSQIISTGMLLSYLNKTFLGNTPILLELTTDENTSFMEIDKTTLKSLEIIEKTSGDKKGSLIDIIDNTFTAMGGRLLKHRLTAPSCDIQEIENRLNFAETFIKHRDKNKILGSLLFEITDIERSLTRVSYHKSSPADLLSIAKVLLTFIKIKNEIQFLVTSSEEYIFNLFKNIYVDKKIPNEIIKAIKANVYSSKAEDFINEGYSEELDQLRSFKNDATKKILDLQNLYIQATSINSLKIKYNRVLGYHIDIRVSHVNKINSCKEFVHRQTTAQASRYTTTELLELEKNIYESDLKIKEKEFEILENLKSKILKIRLLILKISQTIAKLDIALMTALQSLDKNYIRPKITNNNNFFIKEGRHPVIEYLQNIASNDFIPNDCNLNNRHVWLITGPNMAGKSTFLRQNALIAILAQTGLFVPAAEARIGIIDKIFSRVGASDNIGMGQSTFMVEMLETASILRRASGKSFIIFDEIGRGTSTFDGLAIAWAVLEYLIKDLKPRVLFATHYHELTSIKNDYDTVSNYKMHIREWKDKIVFLYRVIKGEADKSYGIEVAKLAGIPNKLISRAYEILYYLEKSNKDELKMTNEKFVKNKLTTENLLEKIVNDIQPDNLTPKDALDIIYKLKEKINNKN